MMFQSFLGLTGRSLMESWSSCVLRNVQRDLFLVIINADFKKVISDYEASVARRASTIFQQLNTSDQNNIRCHLEY